jgi:gamma-glutamylcyclotransferase (GGCT)/AIG2-like uncharacterized protein YtfP
MMKKLYFAYGANTDQDSMMMRCPNAKPINKAVLWDFMLVFRRVADIIPNNNHVVEGGLWEITNACEKSLDLFEGFPNFYTKQEVYVKVKGEDRPVSAMAYVMNTDDMNFTPPPSSYHSTLQRGYRHFGIPYEQLSEAVERSSEDALPEFEIEYEEFRL